MPLRRGHDGEIRPLLLYYNSAEELPLQSTGFTEVGATGFCITELESITAGNSSLLCSCRDEGSSPALSFMCHSPALSRHAVGYGNQGYLLGFTGQDVFHPVSRVPHACPACAPSTSNARRRLSHRPGTEVLMVLPPLPVCIGARPRYAANCRPEENTDGSDRSTHM